METLNGLKILVVDDHRDESTNTRRNIESVGGHRQPAPRAEKRLCRN